MLTQNKEKTPKVREIFPDKVLEGKITVTKGGGIKKDRLLAIHKNSIRRI